MLNVSCLQIVRVLDMYLKDSHIRNNIELTYFPATRKRISHISHGNYVIFFAFYDFLQFRFGKIF